MENSNRGGDGVGEFNDGGGRVGSVPLQLCWKGQERLTVDRVGGSKWNGNPLASPEERESQFEKERDGAHPVPQDRSLIDQSNGIWCCLFFQLNLKPPGPPWSPRQPRSPPAQPSPALPTLSDPRGPWLTPSVLSPLPLTPGTKRHSRPGSAFLPGLPGRKCQPPAPVALSVTRPR